MSVRIGLLEIFTYLNATTASRTIREGEHIVNAGHLILCGITERTSHHLKILSLCLQTSGLTSAPHEITGTLSVDNGYANIVKMVCTCKAGLGEKCKHISAVLIHCSRNNILLFDDLSSTDTKCIWATKKGTSLENYKPQPIADFKCIRNVPLVPLDDEKRRLFKDFFIKSLPNSALSLHNKRFKYNDAGIPKLGEKSSEKEEKSLKMVLEHAKGSPEMLYLAEQICFPIRKCCQIFYHENIVVSNNFTVCVETKSNIKKWQNERQYRITGSRCYSLFTYKGEDWHMKSCKYFWPKSFSSVYTDHGIAYETQARDTYRKTLGLTVLECGLVVSEANPYLAYSPDGIVLDKNNVPIKLLEIKCPYIGREKTAGEFIMHCDYLKIENGYVQLNKKHMYYGQVQLGMAVLNLEKCDFILYSSLDQSYLNILVLKDGDFINTLFQKLKHIF